MANDKQRQEMAELAELCKPTVEIASDGYGGNIYSILAKVRTAMRKRRMLQAYSDLYFDVTNNNDGYAAAIARIRQDVNLIDADKKI